MILFAYSGGAFTGISSAFAHTFNIVDKKWSAVCWKIDFIGIIIINLCHQFLDTFILLYKYPPAFEAAVYLEIIFATYCIIDIITNPTKSHWRITYPIVSSTILTIPSNTISYMSKSPLVHTLAISSIGCSALVIIGGSLFFIGKIPERFWNSPDIDNFNSHIWHHLCIVAAIVSAFKSIPLFYLLD
jgi:predicted membrane channel-forming protein YqfA (hemolysin III family)